MRGVQLFSFTVGHYNIFPGLYDLLDNWFDRKEKVLTYDELSEEWHTMIHKNYNKEMFLRPEIKLKSSFEIAPYHFSYEIFMDRINLYVIFENDADAINFKLRYI